MKVEWKTPQEGNAIFVLFQIEEANKSFKGFTRSCVCYFREVK